MGMQTSIVVLQGCLVLTFLSSSRAYQYPDSYKVTDDVEDYEEGSQSPAPEEQPAKVDYTKYFGGSVSPIAAPSAIHPSSDAFVHSLDFPPFFGSSFSALESVPVSSPAVAGNIYSLPSSPVRYGSPLPSVAGINASASNNQAGFVDPNPYSAFQTLFGGSALQAGVAYPSYQYLPHPQPTYVQPSTSYSLYLPKYHQVKDSVTRDVHKDQRQLSQSSMRKEQDIKKPKRKDDIDEYYDKSKSQEDDDEDEDEDESGEEEDEEGYNFEEADEKPEKPAKKEPSPGKSSYPLKGGSYSSSYKDKPKKISKSESRSNTKQSPVSDKGYTGAYDYPKVELEDPKNDYNYDYNWYPDPSKVSNRDSVIRGQTNNRQVSGYRPTTMRTHSNVYAPVKHNSPPPPPSHSQAARPSYSHPSSKPSYQVSGYHHPGYGPTYSYGTPSPTKNSKVFVPSANIPYVDGFPKANTKQYRMSYATSPSELSQVRSKEVHSAEISNDKKKCIKIERNVSTDPSKTFGGHPMTCYKCYDEATGANSESCSYDTEQTRKSYKKIDPQEIKVEKSVKGPLLIRAKRESPYDLSFSQDTNIGQSVTLVRKVRQYTEYDDSSDYDADETASDEANYRFGPEYFKEGSDESTRSSEYVPETELGENCRKVHKKGVTCMVCEKETGGTYEQCAYASDPNKNSYSYGSSSRYGHGSSSDDDQPRQNRQNSPRQNSPRQSKGRKKQARRDRRYTDLHKSGNLKREVTLLRRVRQSPRASNGARKTTRGVSKNKESDARKHVAEEDETYEIPENFAESVARIREANSQGIVGLDPFFYGAPEDTFSSEERNQGQEKKSDDEDEEDDGEASATTSDGKYEDYFSRLFPELNVKDKSANKKQQDSSEYDDSLNIEDGEESESQQPSRTLIPGFDFQSDFPDYFDEKGQNKDLEKVLGEFSQKDRSACKKVMKDKMTCYQCVDDKGMQHEECMFVAASEPKSKHLAYHEVKQFNLSPKEESQQKPETASKLANTKPLIFHSAAQKQVNPNDGLEAGNYETLKSKRRISLDEDPTLIENDGHVENENSTTNQSDTMDSQAAENIDILRLHPKTTTGGPISKFMIHNQRFYSSTGSQPSENQDQLQRKKRLTPASDLKADANEYNSRDHRKQSDEDSEKSDDDEYYEDADTEDTNEDQRRQVNEERPPEKRSNYNPIPTDPPSFEVPEGPEGAYSVDTEPAYDTTLKITLPRYMLSRSEHEAVFDEVLASG